MHTNATKLGLDVFFQVESLNNELKDKDKKMQENTQRLHKVEKQVGVVVRIRCLGITHYLILQVLGDSLMNRT